MLGLKKDLIKNNNQKTNTVYNNLDNSAHFSKNKNDLTDGQGEKALPVVYVFISSIPDCVLTDKDYESVYPNERATEIIKCSSQKVRREKFFAWELLSYAIETVFKKKFIDLNFSKSENGKWLCDGVEFSLSHSNGVIAVAVSSIPVGVDVELIKEPKQGVIEKYLNDNERKKLQTICEKERTEFLISTWSAKESLFKVANKSSFAPSKYDSLSSLVKSVKIAVREDSYIVTTATDVEVTDVKYHYLGEVY